MGFSPQKCRQSTNVEQHSEQSKKYSSEKRYNGILQNHFSTQNMTQNARVTSIEEDIFLRSKEADSRCCSSQMEILTPESRTRNNYITIQGKLRDETGTASKERTNKSTMSES